jgi:hypothetical protein
MVNALGGSCACFDSRIGRGASCMLTGTVQASMTIEAYSQQGIGLDA